MNLRQSFNRHPWWGKILGCFFGFLIGGPAGALFGLLIGNFFDRGLKEYLSRPHWHYHAEKRAQVQKLFFESTFAVMGHIAKIDGRVSEQEIRMAKTLMQEMGLNATQKKSAIHWFNEGKKAHFNLQKTLVSLKNLSFDNQALLKLFVDLQYRAALVDGFSSKKIQAMNAILHYLGFAPMYEQPHVYHDYFHHSQQKRHHQSSSSTRPNFTTTSLDHSFSILEISPTSNKQDVKRAYRRLISRHHPDKLIAQGLPEEMIKRANEKTQTIRKAYEHICTSKGWE